VLARRVDALRPVAAVPPLPRCCVPVPGKSRWPAAADRRLRSGRRDT